MSSFSLKRNFQKATIKKKFWKWVQIRRKSPSPRQAKNTDIQILSQRNQVNSVGAGCQASYIRDIRFT